MIQRVIITAAPKAPIIAVACQPSKKEGTEMARIAKGINNTVPNNILPVELILLGGSLIVNKKMPLLVSTSM